MPYFTEQHGGPSGLDWFPVKGDNEFQGGEVQEQIPLVLISIYTTFAAAQPSSISSFNQRACRMIL